LRKTPDNLGVINSTWSAKKRLHPVAQEFKFLENPQTEKVRNLLGKECVDGQIASYASVSATLNEKGYSFSIADHVTSPVRSTGGEFRVLKAIRDQGCLGSGFTVQVGL
jgi:hypothetical protein